MGDSSMFADIRLKNQIMDGDSSNLQPSIKDRRSHSTDNEPTKLLLICLCIYIIHLCLNLQNFTFMKKDAKNKDLVNK